MRSFSRFMHVQRPNSNPFQLHNNIHVHCWSVGFHNLNAFESSLSFLLNNLQTKKNLIHRYILPFCHNPPTEFVSKFVVCDFFINRVYFEIQIFSSYLHLKIKIKVVLFMAIGLLKAKHNYNFIKCDMPIFNLFLKIYSKCGEFHDHSPICHVTTTIVYIFKKKLLTSFRGV